MDYESTLTSGISLLSGIFTFVMIICILMSVFSIIVMWKIFKKAGKNGWEAIVPVYNIFILFEITWGNGILVLSLLASIIPVIGTIILLVILVLTYNKLAKSFGKSTGFTVGLIFLSPIFMAILAFDKSEYLGVPDKNKNTATPEQQAVNNVPNIASVGPTISPQISQQPDNLFQVPQGINTAINNINEQPNSMVTPQQSENQLINNVVQPQAMISDSQSVNQINAVSQQQNQQINTINVIPQPQSQPVNNITNSVQMAQQTSSMNQEQQQVNSNVNSTITCPYCNNPINSDAVFCTNCGKQLK